MTVTARSSDVAGTLLDTQSSALTTAIAAAAAGSVQLASLTATQKTLQEQIVARHLTTGRLSAAVVLAATVNSGGMVWGAAGGSGQLVIPTRDADTTALQTRITALGTPAAGFQQSSENQLLNQLNRELLTTVINKGYGSAAAILSSNL
jgi:hypothetical protein